MSKEIKLPLSRTESPWVSDNNAREENRVPDHPGEGSLSFLKKAREALVALFPNADRTRETLR
jgi:hypothetical protein